MVIKRKAQRKISYVEIRIYASPAAFDIEGVIEIDGNPTPFEESRSFSDLDDFRDRCKKTFKIWLPRFFAD